MDALEIGEIGKKWDVEYSNDTGANDDSFWEWWSVTDGIRSFKADTKDDAEWLCSLLNKEGR